MQQKFALAGNVEAKAFSNGAVPRGAKLLVETLLDEARCRLVILPVLVEAHRNNLHSLVAHFRRHVRVLSNVWEVYLEGVVSQSLLEAA